MAPDGCPPVDTDGDRVIDRNDKCPTKAGPAANGGCPDVDRDGDGIADRMDRCPEIPGHPDYAGCAAPDADGDGVADKSDRCPTRPERWNGRRDLDGCPDAGAAVIKVSNRTIALVRYPKFWNHGTRLTADSELAVRVAGAALRSARSRRVVLSVDAEYGLSYGDSVQRAHRRALIIRDELVRATHLTPGEIELNARGPDGTRSVLIEYR